ncbi:uncharacterized protein TNCV_631441 [Trichonephila clavipes]|nr:uncharacterized protein TNCV_631441 [Trichonephila clavipes]
MAALVSEYTLEFFTLLNARGKKELIEWCMKEGLIASSYECPKCNEQMGLNERKSVVLDGFEWRCRIKGVNTHDVCRSIRKNSWFSNISPDPVCRMATLLVPSVPGMSFSILAMGQERGGLLSSDIRTRLPTCTSDWEAFHLGLDW